MRAIDADKLNKTYAGWLTQLEMPDDEKDFCAITTCIAVLEGQPTIEVPRWIPVTERLPKHGEVVLAYTKHNDFETFQWDEKYEEWLGSGLDNDHWNPFVTHWMPLPTPPKDGDSE